MRPPVVIGALVLVTAGCTTQADPEAVQPLPAPTVTQTPTQTPEPVTKPTRLQAAGMVAPVVPVRMEGTVLTPPDDPTVLGWWGKPLGAKRGATLLIGHTVSTGGGTFDDLEQVSTGTRIEVNDRPYRVSSVEVMSTADLARRARVLFSQEGEHRLVLVTCEDYDPTTGHYRSNVVLIAEEW